MKKQRFKPQTITLYLLLGFLLFIGIYCKKENKPLNIVLYDKPLRTIQKAIQGKWFLQYSKGGICSSCKYPANAFHPYISFYSNKIVIGDDSAGVILDTSIEWKQYEYKSINAYLLTYSYQNGYDYPYIKIIDGIYNDTLIVKDYAQDPISLYYIR